MYNVSNKYKEYITKRTVEYEWYGTITFSDGAVAEFKNENVDQNKSKITRQCVKGESLEIGGVFSGELVLGLRDSAKWNICDQSFDYIDSEITLFFKLKYPDGTDESVLCGTFIVTKATRTYHTVSITAYDDINKLSGKLDADMSGNYTPYNAISYICTKTGITLGMTQAQIEALPNGDRTDLKMSVYKKGTAYKKMLGEICAMLGVCAVCDRNNHLVLQTYGTVPVREIGAGQRYSTSYIDYMGNYATLYYTKKNGDVMEREIGHYQPQPVRYLAMNMGKNSLLEKYSDETVDGILYDILNENFRNVRYSPTNIVMPADPSLDIGDMVSVVGGEIQGTYIRTTDTSVDPNRTYYAYNVHYVVVTPVGTENPCVKGWLVKIADEPFPIYTPTLDIQVVPGRTYYERSYYEEVTPVGTENPSEEEWYVIGQQVLCTKLEMPLYGQMKATSEAGTYDLEKDDHATKKEQEQQKKDKDDDEDKKETDGKITNIQGDIRQIQNEIDGITGKMGIGYIFPYQYMSGTLEDGRTDYALRFKFTCDKESEAISFYSMVTFLVTTTVNEGNYGDCNLTVRYYKDGVQSAEAVHTYGDGNAILTLNGVETGLSVGEHTFDVEFSVSGGSLS